MTHKGLKTPKAAAIAGIAFLRFIAVVAIVWGHLRSDSLQLFS